MRFPSAFALGLAGSAAVAALQPSSWRSQSIYQVMTDRFALTNGSSVDCDPSNYCGGTWQGIINKLDYIKGMGFTAIWISPVVKQIPGPTMWGDAYHGYWAQNIYELNDHFGSPQDLKNLAQALHKRGMHLMVDIVTNHMASNSNYTDVDYPIFDPFNNETHFHNPCEIDWSSPESMIMCWMGDDHVALADLRTEDDYVRGIFGSWIQNLTKEYSIDGLRADSALEVDLGFWKNFTAEANTYIIGEAYSGDPNVACPVQDALPGILNYPVYFWLVRAFESNTATFSELNSNLRSIRQKCADATLLGSFMENHDVARFASITPDIVLNANAVAFSFMNDGIPIVYQGQEQAMEGASVPGNRLPLWMAGYNTKSTLYTYIAKFNAIRNLAIKKDAKYTTSMSEFVMSSDKKMLALRKGSAKTPAVSVFSNYGTGAQDHTFVLNPSFTTYTAGQKLVDVVSCKSYQVTSAGRLNVLVHGGKPVIMYPSDKLTGSGICPSITSPSRLRRLVPWI